MKINVLTLFPEMIKNGLSESIIGRAQYEGRLQLDVYNYRDFTSNNRRDVDDAPYGGGTGLVMQVEPVENALRAIDPAHRSHIIYVTPKGRPLTQERVKLLSESEHLTILCGHYEGIDQRIIDNFVDEEISIGDYVLTGGELAAMVIIDAVVRLRKGVLGKDESVEEESFEEYLLEYPHYTRPSNYAGQKVPDVLLSGNHQKIAEWRYSQQLKITYQRRPELFAKHLELYSDCESKSKLRRLLRCLEAVDLLAEAPNYWLYYSGYKKHLQK